jgi:hypothetical protein
MGAGGPMAFHARSPKLSERKTSLCLLIFFHTNTEKQAGQAFGLEMG